MSHRSELHKPHSWYPANAAFWWFISFSSNQQCQHARSVGSAGAFDCSLLSTYLQSFFIPPRNAVFFFFFLQQIDECTNNSQLFLLYPLGIKQNIVTVLFTCVLVYINSFSEKYQGTAEHIPCVFSTILSYYVVLSMIVLSCIYSIFTLSLFH